MLTELLLSRFGKFSGQSFSLGATTLFFGKNEAGKTTVFDALCQALCRPRGNHRLGKLLRERYGEELDASVIGDEGAAEPEPRFDEDEFVDLYSIRANDLIFSLEPGKRWLQRLKSKLFTGGLDPARIAADLEKRASDKGTYRHSRELAKLASERQQLRDRLETRRSEREELLRAQNDLATLALQLAEVADKQRDVENRLAEIDSEQVREEKIRQGRQLRSQLRLIRRRQTLQEELHRLEPYRENRVRELDRIGTTIRSEKERLQGEVGRRQALAEHQLGQQQELAQLTRRLPENSSAARAGRLLLDRIEAFQDNPPQTEAREWKKGNWAVGALLAAGAVAAALLLEGNLLRIAVLTVGFGVAALLWALGTRTRLVADHQAEEHFFHRARHDYLQHARGQQSLIDLASLRAQLSREQTEHADMERRLEDLRSSVAGLEQQTAALTEGADGLLRKISELERDYEQWLQRQQVGSRDEYLARVADRIRIIETAGRLEHELPAAALADPEGFELECERKLRSLDEEGIPLQGRSDDTLQELRHEREQLTQERERLETAARALFVDKEKASAKSSSSLDRVDTDILDFEDRLQRIELQIHSRELDKRAAALAAEILTEIQADTSVQLETLAQELQQSFAQILPDQRAVTLDDLNQSGLGVSDVSGELRSLEQLSTGTRDAFVLAARLALAKRADQDKRLLILDEPFLTLDREREQRALDLLQRFQQETGWQLIFFTKESHLKGSIASTFKNAVVHELRP